MTGTLSFIPFVAFWARQREVDRLEAMSDRLLADIGLRRDQLALLRTHVADRPTPPLRRPSFAAKPSLQGCG